MSKLETQSLNMVKPFAMLQQITKMTRVRLLWMFGASHQLPDICITRDLRWKVFNAFLECLPCTQHQLESKDTAVMNEAQVSALIMLKI